MMGRQVDHLALSGPFHYLEERFLKDLASARKEKPGEASWVLIPGLDVRRRLRKRLVDSGCPLFNVHFVLFPDLAREVLARAPGSGDAVTVLSNRSAAVILKGLVERDIPGTSYFGQVKDRGGFTESLAATLDDLDHAGVTPEMVLTAATRAGAGVSRRKLAEVARIQELWRSTLEGRDYRTPAGLFQAAGAVAGTFPARKLWIYGFYDLNGVQKRFLEGLFAGRDVVFYLPQVDSVDNAYSVPIRQWLERSGFTDSEVTPSPARPEATLFSAAGERREVEETVRRILAVLEVGRTSPDRIAVVYRNRDPYADLLRSVFARAELTGDHHDRMPLSRTRSARALRLFVCAALSDGSRQKVIDFLDVAVPLHPKLGRDGVALAAAWDGFTLEAGLSRGAGSWLPRLTRLFEARYRSDVEDDEGAARESWKERAFELFLGELPRLFDDFERFNKARSWSERTSLLVDVAERWLAPDPLRGVVLDAVQSLAELEGTGEPAEPLVFQEAIEDHLAQTVVEREAPERLPIHVGDVLSIRGLSFDHIFVLGMGEKIFPRAPQQDPILLDRERQILKSMDADLAEKGQALVEESFLFALLRAAAPGLTLSWSRIEPAEGRPRLPSPFLLRVASEKAGAPVDYEGLEEFVERVPLDLMARASLAGRRKPRDVVPVDAASFLDAGTSIDREEFDTLVVAAAAGAERFERVAGICGESPVLVRAITGEVARWKDRVFTRFDGFLESPEAKLAFQKLHGAGRSYSPSRLETYARCPFRYFVESVLGVRSQEDPESQDGASPIDRGTLVHGILHEFLAGCPGGRLAPENRPALRESLLEIARRHVAEFEENRATGFAARWSLQTTILFDELLGWLDFELAREGGCTALGFEVSFGTPPRRGGVETIDVEGDPVTLELPDGSVISFHGRIDRFDYNAATRHGRVIDYKSGKTPKGTEQRRFQEGRYLQLPVYVHALSTIRPDVLTAEAEYLYLQGDPVPFPYPVSDFPKLRRDLARVVAPLVEGIEAGRFFPLPDACGWRGECQFSSICGARIADRFQRKSKDPRIATHPALSGRDVE